MREGSSRIICRKRFKILNRLIFVGFGLMLIFLSVIALLKPDLIGLAIEKSLPGWWFIFIAGLLLYQVSSPDIVLSEAGLEVSILRRNILVSWNQVIRVRNYKYYAIFEVKKLTLLNCIVGIVIAQSFRPSFSMSGSSHTYYSEAMEFAQKKLGNRLIANAR